MCPSLTDKVFQHFFSTFEFHDCVVLQRTRGSFKAPSKVQVILWDIFGFSRNFPDENDFLNFFSFSFFFVDFNDSHPSLYRKWCEIQLCLCVFFGFWIFLFFVFLLFFRKNYRKICDQRGFFLEANFMLLTGIILRSSYNIWMILMPCARSWKNFLLLRQWMQNLSFGACLSCEGRIFQMKKIINLFVQKLPPTRKIGIGNI